MLKKIKIYTNIAKIENPENPKIEIEQKLTINDDGKIIFSSSLMGDGKGHYQKGRKEEFSIEQETVKEIFSYVEEYFKDKPVYGISPGFGMFELDLQDSHNNYHNYYGAISGEHNDVTEYIRHRIFIKDLILLG